MCHTEGEDKLWQGPKGQLVVPRRFLFLCQETHGPAHFGNHAMKRLCAYFWPPELAQVIEGVAGECEICRAYIVKVGQTPPPSMFPAIQGAGQEIL